MAMDLKAQRRAIERAIEKAGGVRALARLIDQPQSNIRFWRDRGWLPAEMCRPVSDKTGVLPRDLRPDLFAPYRRKK